MTPVHTGAGIASVLGNTQPLAIIVLASVFMREKLTGGKILALCLGLAGVVVMALPVFGGENEHDTVGAMLALISSAGAGVASIMVKKLRPGPDLVALAGWRLVAGGLPLLTLSQVFESSRAIHWTASFAGILLFLALAGSALTTLIWFWALQKWDAGTLSLYLFVVPVFGIGIAVGIYGESIRFDDVAGILLILIAMAVALLERSNGIEKRRASIRPQP